MFIVVITIESIICRGVAGRQRPFIYELVLVTYCTFIIFDTVILRPFNPNVRIELTPFWSYSRGYDLEGHSIVPQIIMNVFMYIPIGVMLRKLTGWKGLFIGVTISCVVEIFQLFTKRGLFEFDDIFHNAIGVLIGFVVYETVSRLRRKRTRKKAR